MANSSKFSTSISKVNDAQFETLLSDNDNPHVIFLNGYRMNLASWDSAYPTIAKEHSVFLFNRLGIGKTSKASVGQDANTVVQDMHALFSGLELKPPYLFVAHSMGGLFADLYSKTFSNDVAGIVFVDCPHPDEVIEQRKFKLPIVLKALNAIFKLGDRLFGRYKNSEDENIEKSISQIKAAGDFPEIPIAVVSGQKRMPFVPQSAFELHQKYQSELLALSPLSKHYVCKNSGHFPQISEPERVITAVSDILKIIKST